MSNTINIVARALHAPPSRTTRDLRWTLTRLLTYPAIAGCVAFTYAGFVSPESITGPPALPVVVEGGAR